MSLHLHIHFPKRLHVDSGPAKVRLDNLQLLNLLIFKRYVSSLGIDFTTDSQHIFEACGWYVLMMLVLLHKLLIKASYPSGVTL
jgi:hypothetical protein